MAKKIDEAEVKKECPSCGLGVALDATICEFCGWDFEEEDEWILQIEKLERDLMFEKQKFEPGTVNHKIQSTLHTPALERIEAMRASQTKAEAKAQPAPAPAPAPAPVRAAEPSPGAKVRRVRTVKAAPAPQPQPEPSAAEEPDQKKKTKVVRKVKTG